MSESLNLAITGLAAILGAMVGLVAADRASKGAERREARAERRAAYAEMISAVNEANLTLIAVAHLTGIRAADGTPPTELRGDSEVIGRAVVGLMNASNRVRLVAPKSVTATVTPLFQQGVAKLNEAPGMTELQMVGGADVGNFLAACRADLGIDPALAAPQIPADSLRTGEVEL